MVVNTSSEKVSSFHISNSIFKINTAKLGAAIFIEQYWKISRRQGLLAEFCVSDCSFENNTDKYYRKFPNGRTQPLEIGLGAVYVYFSVVNFYGSVTFINNSGIALAVSGGNAIFDGCSILFERNRGNTGGAITLLGASTIDVGSGTIMEFKDNIATTQGGAIHAAYLSRQNLLSDATCFIRHIDPSLKPDDWNVSMFFFNNTDHGGTKPNAIYATSVLPCTTIGTTGLVVDIHTAFCWKGWHYSGNIPRSPSLNYMDCHTFIETDAGKVQFSSHDFNTSSRVKAFPGWDFQLPITTADDYGYDLSEHTIYSIRYNYSYKSYNLTYAWGTVTSISVPENVSVDVIVETIEERIWFFNFYVDFQPCPPGFVISKGENSTKSCKCANNYGGNVNCIEKVKEAKILKDVWMGDYNGVYYTVPCPYIYCKKHSQQFTLPNNSIALSDHICASNRKGLICGQC